MAALPYVTATGNVEKALLAIKSAATPDAVTQDFVKTILKIPGGSGNQIASLLKKIGFVNADGTPSTLYKRFRNKSSTGAAAADALKHAYNALAARNEYWHALSDDQLRGLIIEETGMEETSPVVSMILNTIKGIRRFADFEATEGAPVETADLPAPLIQSASGGAAPHSHALGLNLSYTINLNLPATSDIAVFNAIFKSLKENLLKASDAE